MSKIQNPFQQANASAYNTLMAQNAGMAGATLTQRFQQSAYNAQAGFYNVNKIVQERYMIDGVSMDFNTFINTLYPEDCAEKTFMILKLKKE